MYLASTFGRAERVNLARNVSGFKRTMRTSGRPERDGGCTASAVSKIPVAFHFLPVL